MKYKVPKIESGRNPQTCEVCGGRMPPVFWVFTEEECFDELDGVYTFQHCKRVGGTVTPLCDFCDQWALQNGVCVCSGCRSERVYAP